MLFVPRENIVYCIAIWILNNYGDGTRLHCKGEGGEGISENISLVEDMQGSEVGFPTCRSATTVDWVATCTYRTQAYGERISSLLVSTCFVHVHCT